MPKFADIAEEVSSLNTEEMAEIRDIINKVLIEKRREELLKNHEEAMKDAKEGKLKFYNNPTDLQNALNEE